MQCAYKSNASTLMYYVKPFPDCLDGATALRSHPPRGWRDGVPPTFSERSPRSTDWSYTDTIMRARALAAHRVEHRVLEERFGCLAQRIGHRSINDMAYAIDRNNNLLCGVVNHALCAVAVCWVLGVGCWVLGVVQCLCVQGSAYTYERVKTGASQAAEWPRYLCH